jgi:chromate reductase
MPLLPSAEVLISSAGTLFDEQGSLRDEDTRKFLQKMLDTFVPWIGKHQLSPIGDK